MEDHGSTIVKGANARHAVWKREAAWPGKRAFVFVFVSVFVVVFVFVHRRTCMSVRVCTCTCVYTCVHVWVSKVGSRIWMATLRAFLSRVSIGPLQLTLCFQFCVHVLFGFAISLVLFNTVWKYVLLQLCHPSTVLLQAVS